MVTLTCHLGHVTYANQWNASDFLHVVAITFTVLIVTELLMVVVTVRTWHWFMAVAQVSVVVRPSDTSFLVALMSNPHIKKSRFSTTPSPPPNTTISLERKTLFYIWYTLIITSKLTDIGTSSDTITGRLLSSSRIPPSILWPWLPHLRAVPPQVRGTYCCQLPASLHHEVSADQICTANIRQVTAVGLRVYQWYLCYNSLAKTWWAVILWLSHIR